MTIRIVTTTVTFTAPDDPYGSEVTLPAGTILDVIPGGAYELAIGLPNLTPLTGQQLAAGAMGGGSDGVSN